METLVVGKLVVESVLMLIRLWWEGVSMSSLSMVE